MEDEVIATLPVKGNQRDWTESALWAELRGRSEADDQKILNFMDRWMSQIQTVLSSSGTSPTAFTLHDANHSFRVAERMAEIIPTDVLPQLSSYELAFILLAAYLHDIGMSPQEKHVSLHYEYLLTGKRSSTTSGAPDLGQIDVDAFLRWIDEDERGVSVPLVTGPVNVNALRLASELVAHYCRYRHNDWSEDWIRKHLASENLGTYAGWLDDLINLCRSHHLGKESLIKEDFNPRPIGSPPQVVHLRYLACALRVADILEFDPERTPDVILEQRNIPQGSVIYWYKDHGISIVKEKDRFTVSARPTSAIVHRAIEVMMNDIDRELQVSRSLSDETHFENCPGLINKLPHRWDLQYAVHRDVRPKPNTYEYIDGAFRPNTRKLLELLSGTQLYHDPLIAIRELIQNAFDAVREQIAYQRLNRADPGQSGLEEALGMLHRVDVRLEQRADGAWLSCSDTGVGMTKAIINNHLLVSGQARRHDILALDRRCKAAGFALGRTGAFGIGVLSYFMISDRVVVTTRRALEPGDADRTGWSFSSEGIGSFGELRQDRTLPSAGSRIELRLRPEIKDLPVWFGKVRDTLKERVCKTPCESQLSASIPGCEVLDFKPGWTLTKAEDIRVKILGGISTPQRGDDLSPTLLAQQDRLERETTELGEKELKRAAEQAVKWISLSGDLSNGLGTFRLHLPYFELPKGASLAFLRAAQADDHLEIGRIGRGFLYLPQRQLALSWKGIAISIERQDDALDATRWASSHYSGYDAGPLVEEI